MTKTTQTARERIGHALFMLAAGADEAMQKEVARHKRTTANNAKAQPKKQKRVVRPNMGRHVSN